MKSIHKAAVWVLISLLGAPVATAQEQRAEQPGRPKLVIENTVHGFGTVTSGTPVRHSFKIKNEGTADLLIHNVAPS